MEKWGYVLLTVILIGLFISLSTLNKIKAPLLERAQLPRCENNDVSISPELKYNIIQYANGRIIQGTGEPYFNNHFIFKNIDYSEIDCVFVIRYEYSYDTIHADMSITIAAIDETHMEVIDTFAFLRPVGLLINQQTAEFIAQNKSVVYDYYNLEVDVQGQTFYYKFYGKSLTGGNRVVMTLDAQSKTISLPETTKEIVPLI